MISIIDIIIIGVYLVFLASMGWIFRRFNHGSKDYFAGGFRMNWWMLGASSFISNFSCWLFTGAANIAYTYGVLIFGFFAVDVLGFVVAFLWFAPRFRRLRLVTAMDAIRLRFGRVSEQFFTWLYFASSLGVAAVWMVSLSIILSSAFHFPPAPVIGVTGAVVVFIALLGGNWAVVASDFIQLLVLLGVTGVASVLTLVRVGGPAAFLAQIPRDHLIFFHRAGSIKYDWLYLVTGLLSAGYMKNNVMYASKYIAAKDERHARKSVVIPLVGYLIMPSLWLIPPLAAFTLAPGLASQVTIPNPGEASYILVVLKVLPTGLVGLLIGGMFSATIASMNVALNKNAGFFVKNFYQPILRPRADDQELLRAGEIATICFGMIITGLALGLALGSEVSLFDSFLYMNAYLGVPLSIPLFLGMFVRRIPRWAGWATTLCGIFMSIFLFLIVPTDFGRNLLEPMLGSAKYSYLVTNKFVMTHLVGVPVTMLFFFSTKFWYRPETAAGETATRDFFQRMRTPVDFEREVGNDNTPAQARILGRLACACGLFVALLLGIPNPWSGRIGIMACAALLLLVGGALLRYSQNPLNVRPAPALRPIQLDLPAAE